jgi:S-adenosylmethionine/arginine decarboxylase-like enzyme
MDTRSQHILFDAVCVNEFTDQDIQFIKNIIEKNLTVVNRIEHKFDPHGETIVFILAESHFTLHTYPENKFFSMDIYICNMDINLQKIIDEISSKIEFSKTEQKLINRGKIGSEVKSQEINIIYFITVITACASILYEFLLAQALSTTMGNTALRYNTTIGIYIASMGFGALFYKKIIRKDILLEFVRLELVLSFVGGVAPIMALVFDYAFNAISKSSGISFFSTTIQSPLFLLNHLLIVIIGFLSGLELPLLIDLGKKFDKKRGNFVLAFDYLGTLIGAIMFPIFILPALHIFTIGYVVSALNISVAFFMMLKFKLENKTYKMITIIMFIMWICLIIFSRELNELFVQKFYFGGQI